MKSPLPLARAAAWADAFVGRIADACTDVLVCGSIRRRKPEVGDIEIVYAPLVTPVEVPGDLFGGAKIELRDALLERLDAAVAAGAIIPGSCLGRRFRQYRVPRLDAQLDLFVVRHPAQWGSIVAIRTGPADYSEWLMRRARHLGLQQINGHLEDNAGAVIETRTEEDYFRALRLDWVPPEHRRAP